MASFLFVTKPEFEPERVGDQSDEIWWSCSRTTQFGDRVLVYVTGLGIAYEWQAASDAISNDEWKYICDVQFRREFDPPISLDEIIAAVSRAEWAPPYLHFRGYRSIQVPESIADRFRELRSDGSETST